MFPQQAAALVLLAFIGVGNALIDVAGFTLIGRMAPDEVLARVFGVLESLVAVSIGIGAVVASAMVEWFGVQTALIAIGLVCPVLAVLSLRDCAAWTAPSTSSTSISELLQRVPMFHPLPLPAIEQLARGLESVEVPAGGAVFTQGEIGDRYYVIESGEADVLGDGRVVATLGPGEGFGEIALLRSTRRTATVVARSAAAAAGAGLGPVPPRRPRLHAERPSAAAASTTCSTATTPTEPFEERRRRRERTPLSMAAPRWDPEPWISGRAALLIADIGGYTEYMSTHRMSLAHAEVNTARMLDRMIDAAPGFDLVEIEGDAAFLSRRSHRREPDPTVTEILQVAVAMHRAFHLERQYVAKNLCPCGGCKQAGNLKLKFVAHVGEVATQSIRGRTSSSAST